MKEEEKKVTIEEMVEKAAKRLDKVLCKSGKANGIITKANFNVVGRSNVYLRGSELANVGTGYDATGETIEEKINSLVDAVEEAVKGSVKKETVIKVETPVGEVEITKEALERGEAMSEEEKVEAAKTAEPIENVVSTEPTTASKSNARRVAVQKAGSKKKSGKKAAKK